MGECSEDTQARFHASLVREQGVPVVTAHGDLDLAAKPRLREQLQQAAAAEAGQVAEGNRFPAVVVDLSGLSFMDAAGLGVLLEHRSVLRERGGDLWLVAPEGGAAHRLLEIVGLDKLLRIHPDRASAIGEINEFLRRS